MARNVGECRKKKVENKRGKDSTAKLSSKQDVGKSRTKVTAFCLFFYLKQVCKMKQFCLRP